MDEQSIFTKSAEVLAQAYQKRDDLAALLDPETGFARRLRGLCKERLDDETLDDESSLKEMYRLESNTWELLYLLMSQRKTDQPLPPSPKELLRQNPYTPTETLAQSILRRNRTLQELVIVREWLQDSAPLPHPPESKIGYWNFTKHRLTHARRMGNKKDLDTLVTELDPDAINRVDDGKVLSADDANYEKALAQAMYGYIRAGRLEDAALLCRRTHRPWRAASINGTLLFSWNAISADLRDEVASDEKIESWTGNKRRKLWKSTCTRAALNTLLSEPDRVVYASLAPSPATSVVLKSACRTWEDHLWTQVSIACESKYSDELARCGGGFWENGLPAVESLGSEDVDQPIADDGWQREISTVLEGLASVGVSEGPPSTDPYHVSQLHVILDRTDKLLNDFAIGLESGEFNPEQENFTHLTRFFAHLCLYLQLMDIEVPNDAVQVILEVYLKVLEDAGQREHIAMYASALGQNAVERYALFLTTLDLSVTTKERREALRQAEQHNLNIVHVAQVAAEKSIAKAFTELPRIPKALPQISIRDVQLSVMENYLIRSIEWTTFMEQTYQEALEQANVIIRYFLALGKVYAAKYLVSIVPPQLAAIDASSEAQAEFYHYTEFFKIWDLLDRVAENQAAEASYTTKGAKMTWLNTFKTVLNEVQEKIETLLTTDWLINEEEVEILSNKADRRQLLVRIRQIYIPEIIIRLHTLLANTGDKIEGNFKKALELVNIVADSRYRLYDDFIGGDDDSHRLNEYLLTIRQGILKGLESGGVDPFAILHT